MSTSQRDWIQARLTRAAQEWGLRSFALKDRENSAIFAEAATASRAEPGSKFVVPLFEPPAPREVESFHFYRPSRGSQSWGTLEACADAVHFFTPPLVKALEDFADTLLPFMRVKPEHLALFTDLDRELAQLHRSRLPLKRDSWTGIYLNAGPHLELGPFRGFKTEHHVIPIERGLCGAAVREGQTIVASDVTASADYLACSIETKSEIVIPIRREDGHIFAELDIDSPHRAAYDEADRQTLEAWCAGLAQRLKPRVLP